MPGDNDPGLSEVAAWHPAHRRSAMGFIDAHVHVWTPDTSHYPLATGWKKEDMKPSSFTPEELFKHCKPAGVDRVVLVQMSFYCPLAESSKIRNSFDNSFILAMMALHRDVFAGTAVVDPQDKNVDRVMGELAKKRVRAFRIYPGLHRGIRP